MKIAIKLLLILFLFTISSCVKTQYRINYLESETVRFTTKLPKVNSFKEDVIIYKWTGSKYIKYLQVYE